MVLIITGEMSRASLRFEKRLNFSNQSETQEMRENSAVKSIITVLKILQIKPYKDTAP